MITKRELINAVDDLGYDLMNLAIRIQNLEDDMKKVKKKSCCCKEDKLEKAIQKAKQPKNADGKFERKIVKKK